MAEKDPLNPENDIFWEGPGAIRPSLQKAAAQAKAARLAEDKPYSLKPTSFGIKNLSKYKKIRNIN